MISSRSSDLNVLLLHGITRQFPVSCQAINWQGLFSEAPNSCMGCYADTDFIREHPQYFEEVAP